MIDKPFNKKATKELINEIEGCLGKNGCGYGDKADAELVIRINTAELDRRYNRWTQLYTSIISALIGALLGASGTYIVVKNIINIH